MKQEIYQAVGINPNQTQEFDDENGAELDEKDPAQPNVAVNAEIKIQNKLPVQLNRNARRQSTVKESLVSQQRRDMRCTYDSNSSKRLDSAISDYDFPIYQDALLKDRSLKEGTQASSAGQ